MFWFAISWWQEMQPAHRLPCDSNVIYVVHSGMRAVTQSEMAAKLTPCSSAMVFADAETAFSFLCKISFFCLSSRAFTSAMCSLSFFLAKQIIQGFVLT